MSVQRKSRSVEEYAYAAMAMLGQIAIADTDETTVVLPSAWLREMQRWEHRISAGDPRADKRSGGRTPAWLDASLNEGDGGYKP